MGNQLSGAYKKSFKKAKRRVIRNSLIITNVALLLGVTLFVWRGGSTTGQGTLQNFTPSQAATNPLDELSSTDIAVNLASMARLEETTAVANQADGQATQLAVLPSDTQVIAKPQIVSTNLKSKDDIEVYTVSAGENVASIAAKFGVTSDSIKWSNNLSSDVVGAGRQLLIPPVNGIVYTVRVGDTPDSLANAYGTSKDRIVAFNDAEIEGLVVGEQILIPDGKKQAPVYRSFVYGSNGYVRGYCTYYAASRVSIPTSWGNARNWADSAKITPGWTVNSVPRPGAIGQTKRGHPLGHVAIVEEVSADGTQIIYSDMNGLAGFGAVGKSGWVPVSRFENYIYR